VARRFRRSEASRRLWGEVAYNGGWGDGESLRRASQHVIRYVFSWQKYSQICLRSSAGSFSKLLSPNSVVVYAVSIGIGRSGTITNLSAVFAGRGREMRGI
jgi:hypothetical protein